MNGARLVRLDDVPPQPWKNGGGVTRELLALPDGGADWQLRLSVADITRDGPFSAFDGVKRWFAVVEGAGVSLTAPGWARLVTAGGPPVHFDGGLAPGCRLLDGATRDLNLMLRGGAAGTLIRADAGPWSPGAASAGLFTMQAGRCEADGQAIALPAGALLWFAQAPATLAFEPAGPGPRRAWWIAARLAPSSASA